MSKSQTYTVVNLFSSSVTVFEPSENLLSLNKVKKYEYVPTEVEDSNECYISKNKSIMDDFPKEKKIICNYFDILKNNILCHEDTDFIMTRSWATKTVKGSYSQYHKHSNNYYSGVLYFDNYDENSAPIEFENPLNVFNNFQIKVSKTNYHNAKKSKIFVTNKLIFFPAYLQHRIGRHQSDTPRYSIAFNFHPCGNYGSGDNELTVKSIK